VPPSRVLGSGPTNGCARRPGSGSCAGCRVVADDAPADAYPLHGIGRGALDDRAQLVCGLPDRRGIPGKESVDRDRVRRHQPAATIAGPGITPEMAPPAYMRPHRCAADDTPGPKDSYVHPGDVIKRPGSSSVAQLGHHPPISHPSSCQRLFPTRQDGLAEGTTDLGSALGTIALDNVTAVDIWLKLEAHANGSRPPMPPPD